MRRPPLRVAVVAALAAALAGGLLQNTAPAHRAATSNISAICAQSANTAEASYREQALTATTGPRVQSASYTAAQRLALLDATKQQAVTDCKSKLNAKQATYGYLPSRMAEIGTDLAITLFASTMICSYTGPTAACKWGIRFAAFTGGFFGSLVFQYMNTGYVDWYAAGYAFLDAAASMFAVAGLDSLGEGYVRAGVRDTWRNVWNLVQPMANRIGGLGSSFANYVSGAATWMWNNVMVHSGAWPAAYHGGGSIEPVLSPVNNTYVAPGMQLRDLGYSGDTSGWTDDVWDLHSGTPGGTSYYNWDFWRSNNTNGDGAISYLIAQGNNCLQSNGYNGSPVYFAPCDINNYNQYWYADGPELMSNGGFCINEVPSYGRFLTDCDGINYTDYPPSKDDQFLVTQGGGDPVPSSISDWKNNLWQYEYN